MDKSLNIILLALTRPFSFFKRWLALKKRIFEQLKSGRKDRGLRKVQLAPEIEDIINKMEERHKMKFPELDIKYSSNAIGSLCVGPISEYPPEKQESAAKWINQGLENVMKLSKKEIRRNNNSRYTIIFPDKLRYYPVRLCADKWEELGHIAGFELGVRDVILNEGFAEAYRFKGLLEEVREGKFPEEWVLRQIETTVKAAKVRARVASALEKKRGHKVPEQSSLKRYELGLKVIEKYIPNLEFRDHDLDELIRRLDECLDYILEVSRVR